jgi:hypothetical protein
MKIYENMGKEMEKEQYNPMDGMGGNILRPV